MSSTTPRNALSENNVRKRRIHRGAEIFFAENVYLYSKITTCYFMFRISTQEIIDQRFRERRFSSFFAKYINLTSEKKTNVT